VTVKKGEAVWLFLEHARGMSGRREWLRVSVDDLLLVHGKVIIPHVFLPPLPSFSRSLTWTAVLCILLFYRQSHDGAQRIIV